MPVIETDLTRVGQLMVSLTTTTMMMITTLLLFIWGIVRYCYAEMYFQAGYAVIRDENLLSSILARDENYNVR